MERYTYDEMAAAVDGETADTDTLENMAIQAVKDGHEGLAVLLMRAAAKAAYEVYFTD